MLACTLIQRAHQRILRPRPIIGTRRPADHSSSTCQKPVVVSMKTGVSDGNSTAHLLRSRRTESGGTCRRGFAECSQVSVELSSCQVQPWERLIYAGCCPHLFVAVTVRKDMRRRRTPGRAGAVMQLPHRESYGGRANGLAHGYGWIARAATHRQLRS